MNSSPSLVANNNKASISAELSPTEQLKQKLRKRLGAAANEPPHGNDNDGSIKSVNPLSIQEQNSKKNAVINVLNQTSQQQGDDATKQESDNKLVSQCNHNSDTSRVEPKQEEGGAIPTMTSSIDGNENCDACVVYKSQLEGLQQQLDAANARNTELVAKYEPDLQCKSESEHESTDVEVEIADGTMKMLKYELATRLVGGPIQDEFVNEMPKSAHKRRFKGARFDQLFKAVDKDPSLVEWKSCPHTKGEMEAMRNDLSEISQDRVPEGHPLDPFQDPKVFDKVFDAVIAAFGSVSESTRTHLIGMKETLRQKVIEDIGARQQNEKKRAQRRAGAVQTTPSSQTLYDLAPLSTPRSSTRHHKPTSSLRGAAKAPSGDQRQQGSSAALRTPPHTPLPRKKLLLSLVLPTARGVARTRDSTNSGNKRERTTSLLSHDAAASSNKRRRTFRPSSPHRGGRSTPAQKNDRKKPGSWIPGRHKK